MAKTMNALIYPHTPNVIAERRLIDVTTIPANKTAWWRPVVEVGNDDYNAATHVKSGPVTTIESARVVDTWTVRAKTAEEVDAEKDIRIDAFDRLNFEVNFDQENRIRALESKTPVTRAQYRAALKARL